MKMSSAPSPSSSESVDKSYLGRLNNSGLADDVLPLNYTRSPLDDYSNSVTYPPRQSELGSIVPPIDDIESLRDSVRKRAWSRTDSDHDTYDEGHDTPDVDSQAHLLSTDGGTKLGQLYCYLTNASNITRWTLYVVPILGATWIPGILSLTAFPHASVWGVRLIFWSIWLTIAWGGWWAALATALTIPGIIRSIAGVIAVTMRRYADWMQVLHRYVTLFIWTFLIWVSFSPIINIKDVNAGDKGKQAISLIARLLFAFFLCAAALLFEKFSIQWIAGKLHERSYAERIADQKFAVYALVILYSHSFDIPGRTVDNVKASQVNPKSRFRKSRHGIRFAATTTATVFGNVASEIAGSPVLQPNSPRAIIQTVLESITESRLLARRLFCSFVKNKSNYLFMEDFEPFFSTKEEATQVFALFDKDSNGDVSLEEMEMACLEFHREQLSIEHSMRDLDSAVGRLDNILMTVYAIVAMLIIAVALDVQVRAIVTGASSLILGLSWLIGGSLQEVLTSIIFLFVKHPFDVGDRVVFNKETYTVKEIRLLSTVFLDSTSTIVQAPNNQLNTLFILNFRRSPEISEGFVFDVAYSTTFEDLERLREKMLEFVTAEKRDYQPVFDVTIKDFPEQSKMTLSADIRYKGNGQQTALKAKRRNKWMCALKTALAEVNICGPSGDPNAPPEVSRYTKVPWALIHEEDQRIRGKETDPGVHHSRTSRWQLSDERAAILESTDDVFGDPHELNMAKTHRNLSHLNVNVGNPSVVKSEA